MILLKSKHWVKQGRGHYPMNLRTRSVDSPWEQRVCVNLEWLLPCCPVTSTSVFKTPVNPSLLSRHFLTWPEFHQSLTRLRDNHVCLYPTPPLMKLLDDSHVWITCNKHHRQPQADSPDFAQLFLTQVALVGSPNFFVLSVL